MLTEIPSPDTAGAPPPCDIGEPIVRTAWYRGLAKYEKASTPQAAGQIANTLLPYLGLWCVMVGMLRSGMPYWSVLPLIALSAGLLIRIFIFFHDCCHGSFFPSRRGNVWFGYLAGILTFTAYESWQHPHNQHHATSGDLDRRGRGDIWTMTVDEFLAAPWYIRFAYRCFRHPFFLLVLGPPLMFLVGHRVPRPGSRSRERSSVFVADLVIAALVTLACFTIGWQTYLMIQLPMMWIAGTGGVWLFYVQHQYEEVYWARHATWDPGKAALEGSSYYRLHPVLQWFTGNIGLHHIHHLRPRIPNYSLQRCYDEVPEVQVTNPLTFRESLKCLFFHLWDEDGNRMISFGDLQRRLRSRARASSHG